MILYAAPGFHFDYLVAPIIVATSIKGVSGHLASNITLDMADYPVPLFSAFSFFKTALTSVFCTANLQVIIE